MRHSTSGLLAQLPRLAAGCDSQRAVLTGEAAAHVHLAAATGSIPGEPARYFTLRPRTVRAITTTQRTLEIDGVEIDATPVGEALRRRIDLFSTVVELADGTAVRVLKREAVLAQLLSEGGLALGLVASLLRVAAEPAIDVDEVRELLKAARQGDRFQPLLELLDVA